jgi:2-dehydro-3-deoxyphosphooctonate aldolase (KDO 8-P synthase)
MQAGLEVLTEVKKRLNLPVLTDVHSVEQVEAAAKVVDVLQIPAFLCRQTDLLLAAGASGKTVHVKKGQFLAPADMRHVAEKVASTGNHKILLCERGSCFGYHDLVVDMRSLVIMRQAGYPVVFDATHSVQQMGGASGSSGGMREYIAPLARAAVAVGIDGIFIECHDRPEVAPSDGPSMLPLAEFRSLVEDLVRLRNAMPR